MADQKLPTVSQAQRRALLDVDDSGRVRGTEATIRALVRGKVIHDPRYRWGRGRADGQLTELGRSLVERLCSQR